jgi:hypothetical protein
LTPFIIRWRASSEKRTSFGVAMTLSPRKFENWLK